MARSTTWILLATLTSSCGKSASGPDDAATANETSTSVVNESQESGAAADGHFANDTSDASLDSGQGSIDASAADSAGPSDTSLEPSVPGTVTVIPSVVLARIGPAFAGLSYEKSHLIGNFFSGGNLALVALLHLLGPSVLRVGGNSVDETLWQAADAGASTADAAAPNIITKGDVDGLAAVTKAAGWSVIYGVNMKTSTPALAADEAAYAATDLAGNLLGFEIGNEVDLYKSTIISPTWSYAIFKAQWESFASAIRASGPGANAPLTGPAAASNYEGYTIPFAADEASRILLLTQHYYRANGMLATSTLDLLLRADPGLVTMLQALSTASVKSGIVNGYRCSECNSFYNGGASGVSDAYGTALWGIDFLFTNARYGASGVNFHGGGNGPGYTPIADSNGAVVGARPLYYGMLLFALAGTGSLYETQASVANLNFTAYAVGPADGSTNVVLVNKDAATTAHITLDVGKTISAATITRLQGPALDATTGTTLGGASVTAMGTWSPQMPGNAPVSGNRVTVDVPPASAALVKTQ